MVTAPPAPRFPTDWPRLGMGCAPLGNIFNVYPEQQAQDTFTAAWDAGVRYYDTAPWYGHGLSEHRLGTALHAHPREYAFISTKVGRVYTPAPRGQDARIRWAGGFNFALHFDYSAAGFAASYAQSQLRLGQPSIDALIIHDLDQGYQGAAFDGHLSALTTSGLAYLHHLKSTGEISSIGMGINDLAAFTQFAPWIDVDFFLVAMPYTLLDQAALHGPMADCVRRGIKVIIGSPFASGLLTNPANPALTYNYAPASPEIRAKAVAIDHVCKLHNVPVMAAALQFPLLHPAVVSVIPGAMSPDQVRQNADNMALTVTPDLWSDLKAKGLIDPATPT
jgi:D-threo-aldose 1-dehydrogenase